MNNARSGSGRNGVPGSISSTDDVAFVRLIRIGPHLVLCERPGNRATKAAPVHRLSGSEPSAFAPTLTSSGQWTPCSSTCGFGITWRASFVTRRPSLLSLPPRDEAQIETFATPHRQSLGKASVRRSTLGPVTENGQNSPSTRDRHDLRMISLGMVEHPRHGSCTIRRLIRRTAGRVV